MMRQQSFVLLLTALLGATASSLQAEPIRFTVTLSGANENPAVPSAGTGSAVVTLDTAAHTLQLSVTFSGLSGVTTASHIHCCQPPPTNAGVATTTPTFAGFPLGVSSGTYERTLDTTQASSYNPAFVTANGATVASAEAALAAGILAGRSYLNVHTNMFPGGEIRGQLVPAPPTSTDDAFATAYITPLIVPATGVLANDIKNGGTTTASLLSGPANGTLALAPDGSFTYTPAALFAGVDIFTYRATSSIAAGGNTATVRITVAESTSPLPPSALRVTSIVGSTVTFAWTPPPNGPAATGYQLEGGLTPGSVQGTLPVGLAPTATVTLPDGSFFVRIRTLAGGVFSEVSNEIPVHVKVAVPPSAPANLLALVVGDTVSLGWSNTFTGGAPAEHLLDVTGALTGTLPIAASDGLSVADVPPGAYTVQVRAANAAGASAPSNQVSFTVPTACSGAPQAVSNFEAYVNAGVVYLRWELPAAGPAPAGYLLNVTGAIVGSLPVPGRTFTSPAPAGTYDLTVTATNVCGNSAPTAVRTVTVP